MYPRFSRLKQDYADMRELEARSPFVAIHKMEGDPPEKYVLNLSSKGIQKVGSNGRPVIVENFLLGIELHDEYPRRGPRFRIMTEVTPVYHPNIAKSGVVCIGDEGEQGWSPSMALDDVVVRIIHMIRYENVGWNSPFNGTAAKWGLKNKHLFPLDESQIIRSDWIEILD